MRCISPSRPLPDGRRINTMAIAVRPWGSGVFGEQAWLIPARLKPRTVTFWRSSAFWRASWRRLETDGEVDARRC